METSYIITKAAVRDQCLAELSPGFKDDCNVQMMAFSSLVSCYLDFGMLKWEVKFSWTFSESNVLGINEMLMIRVYYSFS